MAPPPSECTMAHIAAAKENVPLLARSQLLAKLLGAIEILEGNSGQQKRKAPEESRSWGGADADEDGPTPANQREEERTAGADWRVQDAGARRVVAEPGRVEEENHAADGAGLVDPTWRGEDITI